MFEPLARKQRECQRHQCFFVFVGSVRFFSPLDLPVGGMEPVVSVAVVAIVDVVPVVSVAVVLVLDVAVIPVSVELVVVAVTVVSVTAVSVLAFSSFLQATKSASKERSTRTFLIDSLLNAWGWDVSGVRSRGAIV